MDNIIISLTSVPKRLDTIIYKTIMELKKQSLKCKIILNIPNTYIKWGDYNFNENIFKDNDQLIIHKCSKDYGPATKLLGALEYLKNVNNTQIEYIITVDDDIQYSDLNYLQNLVNNIVNYKNCTITYGGINLEKFPYKCGNGLKYHIVGSADIVAGCRGVLYPVKQLCKNNIIFTFMNKLPDGIFNDDDLYFSIILNLLDIELVSLKEIYSIKLIEDNITSAVEEKTNIHRITNEMNIIQYSVKNNLLPNKKKNY